MTIAPSHFTTVVLFAIFASIIFGITQRIPPRRWFAMELIALFCFWVR
jgi:hypothetical protein